LASRYANTLANRYSLRIGEDCKDSFVYLPIPRMLQQKNVLILTHGSGTFTFSFNRSNSPDLYVIWFVQTMGNALVGRCTKPEESN
jgi:hypothetical protein